MGISTFKVKKDRLTIIGTKFTPVNKISSIPIIISHEFGLNMLSTARYAKHLCKAGYTVYIYDYCGSGSGISRGRKSTQMSIISIQKDLNIIIDYVKQIENIEQVILIGASMGGIVSALVAAKRENDILKLVLIYPALSIPDDARSGYMLGATIDPVNPPETYKCMGYLKLGSAFVKDAQNIDIWKEISGFSKPVLLIHGKKDSMVDYSYSVKANEIYSNSKLVSYRLGKHIFANPITVNSACKHIIKFLK